MEGDAGTRQLNPTGGQERSATGIETDATDADETLESVAGSTEDQSEPTEEVPDAVDEAEPSEAHPRRPARLGRGWATALCASLIVLAAGVAAGGYLALRFHHESEAIAHAEAAALAAAKDCVAATQAPDTAAMIASQSKIIECSTGAFGVQAPLYSGVLAEAYQTANVQVHVSDMRAAVERHNDDGSIDVLVAVRTKVTNSQAADQEQGYRLRVTMAPADGTYKISDLKQVAS
jgi:Mce-associated membrane protein